MRKVLIVSPRFPPKNAADLHRVRVSLPWFRQFGWAPTILCVDPATADCEDDPMLAESLPLDVPVTRVRAWSQAMCRRFGFAQLGYRSLVPLYRAGSDILRRERHDVVFFSTTVFLSFVLGPLWKRRFGCRIVYDFQDPWYSEQSPYTPETVPGRWWKYRLDQWLARHFERFAMRSADHVVSVSESYVRDLLRRYAWLQSSQFTVLPFAATEADHAFVRRKSIKQTIFRPDGRTLHWVSAGRAGPDMDAVLRALFRCVAGFRQREPELAARLRLHFVGTNYAPPERTYKLVEPITRELSVDDLVEETSERLPYFDTIALNEASDAILLIGSVHADYTASKLFSCVLAKKPILALFHRESLVSRLAARFSNVFLATFAESPSEPAFLARVAEGIAWLRAPTFDASTIDAELKPWSDEAATSRQCAIFDQVCAGAPLEAAARLESRALP
jgi:hypothetical protein